MTFPQDPRVKIILIGDSGVGKTSLFTSFADQSYTSSHIPTIGVDFRLKRIHVGDQPVKLQIWDTAGLERYRALTSNYFRGTDVICLMYDITNRESFNNLANWIRIIQQTTDEEFVYLVVGNKMDLTAHRMVSDEEGALFASSISAGFFETSAKTFLHLTDVFSFMAQEVLKRGVKHQPRVLVVLESEPKPKRFCGWF
jgi:small GTP-binding protein